MALIQKKVRMYLAIHPTGFFQTFKPKSTKRQGVVSIYIVPGAMSIHFSELDHSCIPWT